MCSGLLETRYRLAFRIFPVEDNYKISLKAFLRFWWYWSCQVSLEPHKKATTFMWNYLRPSIMLNNANLSLVHMGPVQLLFLFSPCSIQEKCWLVLCRTSWWFEETWMVCLCIGQRVQLKWMWWKEHPNTFFA